MLDNVYTLVILYTSMNLPIAIWMMQFVPGRGAQGGARGRHRSTARNLMRTLISWIVVPMTAPRARRDQPDLLHLQLERVHVRAVNLTAVRGLDGADLPGRLHLQPRTVPRRKLCAAATRVVSLPVLIAGFAAQDKLVRGQAREAAHQLSWTANPASTGSDTSVAAAHSFPRNSPGWR